MSSLGHGPIALLLLQVHFVCDLLAPALSKQPTRVMRVKQQRSGFIIIVLFPLVLKV